MEEKLFISFATGMAKKITKKFQIKFRIIHVALRKM